MVEVVAAILERDGKILICRRRRDQSHPLKWEFPGGKVEDGESPADALARELKEELDVEAARGEQMAGYEFAYPGKKPIRLLFFRVQSYIGEPRNVIFQEMRWEAPERLAEFDFVEGDREFLRSFGAGS